MDELVKSLRICADGEHCDQCAKWDIKQNGGRNACEYAICTEAANAIAELNSQLDDFKRLCLPLKENRLYKYSGGSFVEVFLVPMPEPPKEGET